MLHPHLDVARFSPPSSAPSPSGPIRSRPSASVRPRLFASVRLGRFRNRSAAGPRRFHPAANTPTTRSARLVLVGAVIFAAFTAPANAAVFDIADGDSNGLIAAIHAANTNGEPDIINLATNGTYTLRRVVHTGDFLPGEPGDDRNGLPPILSEITFNGFGAMIKRSDVPGTTDFRVLQIGDLGQPGSAKFGQLTISNGFHYGIAGGIAVFAGTAGFEQCVIRDNTVRFGFGGGIYNLARCSLVDCNLAFNFADATCFGCPGLPPFGADGVFNSGELLVERCNVQLNLGTGILNQDGGIASITSTQVYENSGIGIENAQDCESIIINSEITSNAFGLANAGTAQLYDSRISKNWLGVENTGDLEMVECDVFNNQDRDTPFNYSMGGIWNQGHARIFRTRVRDNRSVIPDFAGGVTTLSASFSPAALLLDACEISGNRTNGDGGGILARLEASATITNTTISSNRADRGGAIANYSSVVSIVHSSIAGNRANVGGGIFVTEDGVYFPGDGLVTLLNTIVAQQSQGADCAINAGWLYSMGHNLDSDGTCNLDSNGDIAFGFANLGPLADNGGPTLTHALLPGSDALDAGDPTACAADPVGGVDQRGYPRPAGAGCDIGAFEAGDYDGDGVIDGVDVCVSPPAAAVNPAGGPLGDIDDDCAVTLVDFQYFEICLLLAGPDTIPLFTECRDVFDFDADQDVDLIDYARIQAAIASPAE
jgi:hypothetical protein